ncbi:MAG: alpha/beta fold hydrolase [Candidatus Lokiarchaeota archaeon]|nr:alpha/beta fold hydrolase [Candidatus Lokiarchaeota archaeon]
MKINSIEKSIKISFKTENSQNFFLDARFLENSIDEGEIRPLIILLHGWNNNRSELDYLIPGFLENNFKVLNYSYRGHGKSTGIRDLRMIYDDFDRVLNYVLDGGIPDIDFNNINLVGQSFGAGISLTKGYKNEKIKHIFALNPFFNPNTTIKSNRNILIRLYLWFTGLRIDEKNAKFLAPEYYLVSKPENASRLFLIMTRKDSYIPFSEKKKLLEHLKLPERNIKIFNTGNHTFNGIKNEVSQQIVLWLKKLYLIN